MDAVDLSRCKIILFVCLCFVVFLGGGRGGTQKFISNSGTEKHTGVCMLANFYSSQNQPVFRKQNIVENRGTSYHADVKN